MGLTEEISTLTMIYRALLILVLILRARVRIGLRVLIARTR
jgi:hypothetical protein